MFLPKIFIPLLLFSFLKSNAVLIRKIAILDVTVRNSETNDAEVFSLKHVLKVSGLPFILTTNVDTAKKYSAIIVSSKTETNTFTVIEKDSLISYVSKGGILFSPYMRDPYFYSLFGLNGGGNASDHYKIVFNTFLNDPSFKWLNDTMETTISLGNPIFTSVINTRYYTLNGALSLAKYNNNNEAVTRNSSGTGFAYALGFSFKNVILVNQQDRDYDANRYYSNEFEPTSDAIILFLKAALLNHIPYSPYLHTSPYNSKSTVMITHDVDATTAFDTMGYYSAYENQINLKASYLITTHYVNDGALSDFYNIFTIPKVQNLVTQGHILGSHSVGHFPDFDIETTFPLGTLGNTSSNYLPFNQGNANPTSNGSVLGEAEVSKNLLNTNFGLQIKTFRPGYLCFNDKLINALDTLNYKFSTTFSANDVLTNFPYRSKKNSSSDGAVTNVWEIPMTISDVINADPITAVNYPQRVVKWLNVVEKNKKNYAPTVLLIHPNRMFKLYAEQSFISGLGNEVLVTNLEEYGDYWAARDSIEFVSALNNGTLTITIPNKFFPLPNSISFIIDKGKLLTQIIVKDGGGNNISFISSDWETNDKILYLQNFPIVNVKENYIVNRSPKLNIFPNPCITNSIIEMDRNYNSIECFIYNMDGKIVEQQCTRHSSYLSLVNNNYSGLYFVMVYADGESKGVLKVLFK